MKYFSDYKFIYDDLNPDIVCGKYESEVIDILQELLTTEEIVNMCLVVNYKDESHPRRGWAMRDLKWSNYFLVEIWKQSSYEDYLKVLRHELTHVKQMYRRELWLENEAGQWLYYWHGKLHEYKGKEDDLSFEKYHSTPDAYNTLPWEEEAFSFEEL